MRKLNNDNFKNMHDHDNNKPDFGMMLMMMFCCAVLPLAIVFLGGTALSNGSSKWFIFALMGVFMIGHFLMMARSHRQGEEKQGETGKASGEGPHSGHGCH